MQSTSIKRPRWDVCQVQCSSAAPPEEWAQMHSVIHQTRQTRRVVRGVHAFLLREAADGGLVIPEWDTREDSMAQSRCGSDECDSVMHLMDEDIHVVDNNDEVVGEEEEGVYESGGIMGCGQSRRVKALADNRVFFDGYIRDGTKMLRSTPHRNALRSPYPCPGGIARFPLKPASEQIPWAVEFPAYEPAEFTAPFVLKMPVWADVPDVRNVAFNCYDSKCGVDRTSFEGKYALAHDTNRPLNPRGRTGMSGRGSLGRFGPNHAADPIISTWRRDADGCKVLDDNGDPILMFVAIRRKDTGDWAIPGGMVDPGENVSLTLKREFGEETMASMDMTPSQRDTLMKELDDVFKQGVLVYSGYVDDIRNTDNAWIETTCVNFHDEDGSSFSKFKLAAGDDAGEVAWTEYYDDMPLYATHTMLIDTVHKMRVAWERHMSQK
eukprot:m.161000 g.161000  ORF g.161000 m.161000 type:complete len:437 (+) comp12017_c0_seq1:349-1659(+)